MRYRTAFFLLFFAAFISLTFQTPQGVIEASLYLDCINDADNPIDILKEASNCIDRKIMNGEEGSKLEEDVASHNYRIRNADNSTNTTWYDELIHMRLGKNDFIKRLAIAKPNLDVILDEYNKVLVFGGEFNHKYSIWVWKPDISEKDAPPKELSLIDLLAGDKSDKQFANFLKNKNNYNNSRIPDIIKNWISGKGRHTIKAILPRLCGNTDVSLGDKPTNDKKWEEYFKPYDPVYGQPRCITDAINSNTSPLSFLTIDEQGEYFVWLSAKGTNALPIPWYKKFEEKVRNEKLVGWWAIAKMDNCEVYPIENSAAYVTVCGDSIQCFRFKGDLDFYTPLELLDARDQRTLCEKLKDPVNYEGSPIKNLSRIWLNRNEEYKIVSYFEDKEIDIDESLKSQLAANLAVDFEKKYYLVEVTESGHVKYKVYDNGSYRDSDWYNSKIHSWRNPWIAKLALVKNIHVKIIDSSDVRRNGLVSFVISKGNKHFFWSWKLNSNPDDLEEYTLLDSIYDNSPNKIIRSKYSEAIKNYPHIFFDTYLKSNILDHFNGRFWKICQIYPQAVRLTSPYTPLTLIESNSTTIIPPPLEKAFDNGGKLQYLIKNDNYHIYGSTIVSTSREVWFKDVYHFGDPWLAWLCLADPSIKIVKADPGNYTRVCMISSKDKMNLWSWVAVRPNSGAPPVEYKLVNGAENFELTGKSKGEYVNSLYEHLDRTSESEQVFFLERADKPNAFVLSDFLSYATGSPDRVLLWREQKTDARTLLRVGVQPDAIKVNIVEGLSGPDFWKQIAERYQHDWCKEEFKVQIGRSTKSNLEVWFGPQRLGLAEGDQLGVFQSSLLGKRNFGFANYSNILKLIDGAVFKPIKDNPGIKPDKNVFMQSCSADKWDRLIWRANPLGYFDRVPTSN